MIVGLTNHLQVLTPYPALAITRKIQFLQCLSIAYPAIEISREKWHYFYSGLLSDIRITRFI